MINYQTLIDRWQDGELAAWSEQLAAQIDAGLSRQRYGDLARWLEALAALPDLQVDHVELTDARVGVSSDQQPAAEQLAQLETALRGMHPWRKGPFELFGLHIDTEWRSDWKWERLRQAITPLTGRRVLDVGCGSGYQAYARRGCR